MATQNDVTGDSLISRNNSKEFNNNYEKAFGGEPKHDVCQNCESKSIRTIFSNPKQKYCNNCGYDLINDTMPDKKAEKETSANIISGTGVKAPEWLKDKFRDIDKNMTGYRSSQASDMFKGSF